MTPIKPFPEYRWRWFSNEPSESLLLPPVFLGVLRVLAAHEGQRPADADVITDLARVGEETSSPVNLARTEERNLIRNSGQYWKGTGLLSPERGIIRVTPLGRMVAEGRITRGEFAAIMVEQTVLPNPWTYSPEQIAKWEDAGIKIRPLRLIIEIMGELGRSHGGVDEAYITPWELIRICIPLAGTNANAEAIASAIARHRRRDLDVSDWPDCAPGANDIRLAKEFLRFLANFGICQRITAGLSINHQYKLEEFDALAAADGVRETIFDEEVDANVIIDSARHSGLPSIIQRRRTMISVLARPGQSRFRQDILAAYHSRCLVTGDRIDAILEAGHIIPVEYHGADDQGNGLCLRVDVHRLFDSGNIRIRPTGELVFSELLLASRNYGGLPERIAIPAFVNPANIAWRDQYL